MDKFVVIGDVSCDLSQEERLFFKVDDYMTGHLTVDDAQFVTKLCWEDISARELFDILKDKKRSVSTSPANAEEVCAFFETYLKQGYDILSISLSGRISATYSFTVTAANKLKQAYPDRRIVCFDSMRMSKGFGYIVAMAALKKSEGLSLDETLAYITEIRPRVHQMGPIDDLFFVARRGRISKAKAIFGTFAGVRPMGDYSADGYTNVLAKAKGANKAMQATIEYVKATIVDPEDQYIFIAHSDRAELAERYRQMIESEIKCKKVFLSEIFMGCAPNIGPGMISVNYLGAPITEDMSKEEGILADILKKL